MGTTTEEGLAGLLMVLTTMENGAMDSDMAKELTNSQMGLHTKVDGTLIRCTDMER